MRFLLMSLLVVVRMTYGAEESLPAKIVEPTEVQASVNKRILGVGGGAGLPNLLGAEIFIYALPRFQIGTTYGLAPNIGPFSPRLNGEQISDKTSTGVAITLAPEFQMRWTAWTPFVRYYPMERNFYLQFGLSLFTTYVKLNSDLLDAAGQRIPGASFTGEGRVLQYLPTVSIGHLFTSGLFFCNFALGATFVPSSFETWMSLKGDLPDSLGGSTSNEALVKGIQSRVNRVLKKGMGIFQREIPLVPSFSLTVGIFI